MNRPIDEDAAWQDIRARWRLREDTVYLNHGSFGPPPEPVRVARREWLDRLDAQPMDFFFRTVEPALSQARVSLARFVGTAVENLVFVENATYGMNVVADSLSLSPGDEVVLTDHEYGAVHRIWERACRRAGTVGPIIATLPMPIQSADQMVDAVFAAVSGRTRLIVVSHVTSATAAILPVREICRRARESNIAVCIDGPHAPAQLPLNVDSLDCDFYTASCHKWLCASFGSGFLYVHPRQQETVEPVLLSWGRLLPNEPVAWHEEFTWTGTRDYSPYLTIPVAIGFLESVGLAAFRTRTHYLARYARQRLVELTGLAPPVPDSDQWYGSMALVPLPPGEALPLQKTLWERHGIEVPIIPFGERRYIRVSCHLYTRTADIDRLVTALARC